MAATWKIMIKQKLHKQIDLVGGKQFLIMFAKSHTQQCKMSVFMIQHCIAVNCMVNFRCWCICTRSFLSLSLSRSNRLKPNNLLRPVEIFNAYCSVIFVGLSCATDFTCRKCAIYSLMCTLHGHSPNLHTKKRALFSIIHEKEQKTKTTPTEERKKRANKKCIDFGWLCTLKWRICWVCIHFSNLLFISSLLSVRCL